MARLTDAKQRDIVRTLIDKFIAANGLSTGCVPEPGCSCAGCDAERDAIMRTWADEHGVARLPGTLTDHLGTEQPAALPEATTEGRNQPENENERPMTQTLADSQKTIANVEIRRFGEQITLPDNMTYKQAIDVITRRAEYENEVSLFVADFPVFPLDGAHALFQVLRQTFGFVENITEWTFFGPKRPQMIAVRTGVDTTVQVPWGKFALPPQIGGVLNVGVQQSGYQLTFRVAAETQRKHEAFIEGLFQKVRDYLATGSIYRGKAVSVRFVSDRKDEDGNPLPMPEPTFMDTDVNEAMLTFTSETDAAIQTNLFTPITRLKDLIANGIPVKRGVLLGGPYGTGKTLTARVAAKLAQQHGITFVYVKRADELAHAIEFAKPYCEPAVVVFCEDIDRSTSGDRDADMDAILNTLDGVDTKAMNLITLLTTNHIERITRAMLRPGRLDAVITIPPPDAEAVEKLLRIYGAGVISPNANLTDVGRELDGAIPAIVAEVVKRAKLAQLRLQRPGTKITEISAVALLESAKTIKSQRNLLATEAEPCAVAVDD